MIKKSLLAIVVLSLFMCGTSYGQFIPIRPSDIGRGQGSGPVNDVFDISGLLGVSPNTITMRVANGYVSATEDSWTVSESESATFILGGTGVAESLVIHGGNLGSAGNLGQNGSQPRDGISAATGETWTMISNLDTTRYTADNVGNDYFVDYTSMVDSGNVESQAGGFRWQSDQPVSSFSVFSRNTVDLNNNYNVRFRVVNAVPEPAAGTILMLAGLAVLRRKRS